MNWICSWISNKKNTASFLQADDDTHSFRLTSKDWMKSLASSVMASKASSSKSNSARVMLLKVSASLSPMKGDSPDSLREE